MLSLLSATKRTDIVRVCHHSSTMSVLFVAARPVLICHNYGEHADPPGAQTVSSRCECCECRSSLLFYWAAYAQSLRPKGQYFRGCSTRSIGPPPKGGHPRQRNTHLMRLLRRASQTSNDGESLASSGGNHTRQVLRLHLYHSEACCCLLGFYGTARRCELCVTKCRPAKSHPFSTCYTDISAQVLGDCLSKGPNAPGHRRSFDALCRGK